MKESHKEKLGSNKIDEEIFCVICGGTIETYWDSRYNGTRSTCKSCGINWSES